MIDHRKYQSALRPRSGAIGKTFQDGGFAFGRFRLFPSHGILLDDGREINIGGRAMTILGALIQQAGKVVSKEDLIRTAWPSVFVDEGNLRVHISMIRKALGDGSETSEFIANVVGRGYQFVARVHEVDDASLNAFIQRRNLTTSSPTRLQRPLTRILGREDSIGKIVQMLKEQRLVTIVGSGGVGKTTVALAAARHLANGFVEETYFLDLSAIFDRDFVPYALATAMNVAVEPDKPLAGLVSYLKQREALIVLDSCEHVIDAAARLVEALLKGAPELRVLATSHEPLMADGEWLFQLPPLDFPRNGCELTLEQATRFPAIELLIERAVSNDRSITLDNFDVPFIIEICSKLDGNPLAIEMAAAQLEVFGICGLVEHLADRLNILTVGRRTAVPRHQTFRSMLDWSHENLPPFEQILLRRLSVFSGAFTLEAAELVIGDEQLSTSIVADGVGSLFGKSLLHSVRTVHGVSYCLLETTRFYAAEKLTEADEAGRVRRLHLQYVIDNLERAEVEWTVTNPAIWLDRYPTFLDDMRSALDWAFSPEGHMAAGVKLISLAIPLALQLGLVEEFREHADMALAKVQALELVKLMEEIRVAKQLLEVGSNTAPLLPALAVRTS